MFTSRIAQAFGVVLAVGAFSVIARGELLVSYESDIDRIPATPGIVDLNTDDIATITITVTALDREEPFIGVGFEFAGTPVGGPFDRVVVNGALTVSEFMFAEPFQDANVWFINERLPDPAAVTHFLVGPFSYPVTLATFNVVIDDFGFVVQDTGPPFIMDGHGVPFDITAGSESFTVRSTVPEPATAVLLIVATAMLVRRRGFGT